MHNSFALRQQLLGIVQASSEILIEIIPISTVANDSFALYITFGLFEGSSVSETGVYKEALEQDR